MDWPRIEAIVYGEETAPRDVMGPRIRNLNSGLHSGKNSHVLPSRWIIKEIVWDMVNGGLLMYGVGKNRSSGQLKRLIHLFGYLWRIIFHLLPDKN